ncbi:MAG: hypothetical protein CBCREVIR_0971 [Candidatus Burkholderia crenata]|nr:MAG: hypothetical protein CBCREVIR_0971 [Candidatus Burkholderia crenata]
MAKAWAAPGHRAAGAEASAGQTARRSFLARSGAKPLHCKPQCDRLASVRAMPLRDSATGGTVTASDITSIVPRRERDMNARLELVQNNVPYRGPGPVRSGPSRTDCA